MFFHPESSSESEPRLIPRNTMGSFQAVTFSWENWEGPSYDIVIHFVTGNIARVCICPFFFEVLKSSIHGFFKGGYMGTANKNTYKNRWHMGRCGKERAAPDTCESILIQIDHLLRNRATPSSSALKLYTTELQNRQIEQVCGWSIVPQGIAIFQKMKIGVSQSSKCWFTSRIEQSNLLLDFCLRNNTSERFVIAAHVGSDYFKLTHNTEQNIWNTGPNK